MNEPKNAFLDYRSPYVWQSRALNFNKQLIKKLNHIQGCNLKQAQPRTKKIGIPQHRNGPFQHRLLDLSASNSSLSPSLSSQEGKEDELYGKNYAQKYNHAAKMARANYADHCNPSRVSSHFVSHVAPSEWPPPGNRCPVHGLSPPHPYKNQKGSRMPSAADLHEYGLPAPHYLSRPYGYLYSDNQYMAHYPHYFSSHMYLPGSYMPVPYLGANLYPSKLMPPTYPQQRRNHSLEYSNSVRLYPERNATGNKCRGHLVVLAIILTVITIGVVMGILLAVSIN